MIFDIRGVTASGTHFIVERQTRELKYFLNRSVTYSIFPIVQQALKGDWDFRLQLDNPVVLLDFVFAEDEADE